VAVVTAFNDPTAASDLAAYRAQYGLAPCTVASGCFRLVSQTGSTTSLPGTSAAWNVPALRDHGRHLRRSAPKLPHPVVEANSTAISDLGTAENEAVALGAKFITNDWYGPESASETSDDTYFDHPGHRITAPAGDGGYGAVYPAASQLRDRCRRATLTTDSSASAATTSPPGRNSGSGLLRLRAQARLADRHRLHLQDVERPRGGRN